VYRSLNDNPPAFIVPFRGTLTARSTLHKSARRPKRSANGRCANQDFALLHTSPLMTATTSAPWRLHPDHRPSCKIELPMQQGWHPVGCAPCQTFGNWFTLIVRAYWVLREICKVGKGIDVSHRTQPCTRIADGADIYAALPADQIIRGSRAKPVWRNQRPIFSPYLEQTIGIGHRPCTVRAAE
jgi:hypothetical protein